MTVNCGPLTLRTRQRLVHRHAVGHRAIHRPAAGGIDAVGHQHQRSRHRAPHPPHPGCSWPPWPRRCRAAPGSCCRPRHSARLRHHMDRHASRSPLPDGSRCRPATPPRSLPAPSRHGWRKAGCSPPSRRQNPRRWRVVRPSIKRREVHRETPPPHSCRPPRWPRSTVRSPPRRGIHRSRWRADWPRLRRQCRCRSRRRRCPPRDRGTGAQVRGAGQLGIEADVADPAGRQRRRATVVQGARRRSSSPRPRAVLK